MVLWQKSFNIGYILWCYSCFMGELNQLLIPLFHENIQLECKVHYILQVTSELCENNGLKV